MIKKIISVVLVFSILCFCLFGNVGQAGASPVVIIAAIAEEALILLDAGLTASNILSLADMAYRYSQSGVTVPEFNSEGKNLNITVQDIENAQAWLADVYPLLPSEITVDGGNDVIGNTIPPLSDYTPTVSEKYFFENMPFATNGYRKLNILGFGSIVSWMTYENTLTSKFTLTDPYTLSYVQAVFDVGNAVVSWSTPEGTGSVTVNNFPYDYVGFVDQIRFDVVTKDDPDHAGKKINQVLFRWHDFNYDSWSDDSFIPAVDFTNTYGELTLSMVAGSFEPNNINMETSATYPKTDLTYTPKTPVARTVAEIPTDWEKVINPTAGEETPTDILGFLASLLDKLLKLPGLIADSIVDAFTTINPGDSVDFTKLRVASDLFTSKFPFCLPWDLKNMISTFGAGSTAAPTFSIGLGTEATTTVISLSRFDNIAAAARVLELFVFNIGLIFGTRKLLGGAS